LILSTLETKELRQRLPQAVDYSVVLIVDQRMSMFFGSSRDTKSVVAAKAAALFAWRALALRKRVGAISFSDRDIEEIFPQYSRLRVRLILHSILAQNHALSPLANVRSNPGMLNEVLRRATRFTANSLVFLISDASGCTEETYTLINKLCRKSSVLVALVYDRRQTDCQIHRSFSADLLQRSPPIAKRDATRAKFSNSALEVQSRFGVGFFPRSVPIVPLSTHKEVALQLLRIWGKCDTSTGTGRQGVNSPRSTDQVTSADPMNDEGT
jgi:uncharacterized protein (DUF58 family)